MSWLPSFRPAARRTGTAFFDDDTIDALRHPRAHRAFAGLPALVFVPAGKVAAGKLAQALAYGARTLLVRGDFDTCLRLVRETAETVGVALLNSINPGRLEGQKDYSTLFQAFALLADKENLRLIVLGEGSQLERLGGEIEALGLSSMIDLAGFTSNPFAYMRQADGVVMSSRWEGFGNVLAEALAQGTPVVSTDCPSGPAEILDQGKYGPLVPVGDVQALALACRRLMSDATLYRRCSENCLAAWQQLQMKAEWGDMIRRFLEGPTKHEAWRQAHCLTAVEQSRRQRRERFV